MAWDTGGAAWDFVLSEGAPISPSAAALRDAFKASLVAQINRQANQGKVVRDDVVLKAINYGGVALTAEGFEADPVSTNHVSTTTAIDINSNSIPFRPGSQTTKVSDVFKNVRATTGNDVAFTHSITTVTGGGTLANGTYLVELLFSAIPIGDQVGTFDVFLEGKQVLNDYNPATDRARIGQVNIDVDSEPEILDSKPAGVVADLFDTLAGIVKRFEIDITGDDGLQIKLDPTSSSAAPPSIAGVRILRGDTPRIVDITLKGSGWSDPAAQYSYSAAVPAGKQFAPFFGANVDTIEVKFNKHVVQANGSSLSGSGGTSLFTLYYTQAGTSYPTDKETVQSLNPSSVTYDEATLTATLVFNSVLGARNKYRLDVSDTIRDAAGNNLDGQWANSYGSTTTVNGLPVYTADNTANDPLDNFLVSGDGVPGGLFQFKFAILPGDFNQNGVVDSADDDSGILKDGNGDGAIDSTDAAIVSTNLDQRLSLLDKVGPGENRGDYNDDEVVDIGDYLLWKASFGLTNSPNDQPADGNGDGSVNAADYTIWRNNSGDRSAWYTGTPPAQAAAIVEVDFDHAPRVVNVTISGSQSAHAPFSYDDPEGESTDFDGSGVQLRTVPVGGVDTVAITFSEDVNVEDYFIRFIGLRTAAAPALLAFSYDAGTQTATWRFELVDEADHYVIKLYDDITDVEGNHLDGEWTNPAAVWTTNAAVSEFPSGNGTAGGHFQFVITILPGDANLNNLVSEDDYDVVQLYWNSTSQTFAHGDFTGDGWVAVADLNIVYINFDTDLQSLFIICDLNGDYDVDEDDEAIFLYSYSTGLENPTWADGDFNIDGYLNGDDFNMVGNQLGIQLTLAA
jgi:hypothetical protein